MRKSLQQPKRILSRMSDNEMEAASEGGEEDSLGQLHKTLEGEKTMGYERIVEQLELRLKEEIEKNRRLTAIINRLTEPNDLDWSLDEDGEEILNEQGMLKKEIRYPETLR
jgi:hypothetical protein